VNSATPGVTIALSQFFGQHGYLPNLVDLPHNVNMHGTFVAAGSGIRKRDDPVAGVRAIDLAPTICAIAGCEMGPYADGRATADGVSLLPLLDGETDSLGRDVLREQAAPLGFRPGFRGLRTTPSNPLGHWHYIEYETGERELYDSVEDPWELKNVADDPEFAEVAAALSERLAAEFADEAAAPEG